MFPGFRFFRISGFRKTKLYKNLLIIEGRDCKHRNIDKSFTYDSVILTFSSINFWKFKATCTCPGVYSRWAECYSFFLGWFLGGRVCSAVSHCFWSICGPQSVPCKIFGRHSVFNRIPGLFNFCGSFFCTS